VPGNSTEPAEAVQDSSTVADTHSRVPELDGFRAIAVWMVLGAHLVDGWRLPAGALRGVPAPLVFVLSRGWLGVDLFFVLSGLLITGILLDSRERPSYFRDFYARRFLRIIPLYFTVITITFLAYRSPVLYFLLSYCFLANIAGVLRVGVPHGPGVFWSWAVEEHFYLAWPMVIRFMSRNSLIITCLVIFLASPVLRGIAAARGLDPAQEIYPLSWYRFDGLALGALLAIWLRSKACSPKKSLRLAGAMAMLSLLIVAAGAPFGVLGTRTVANIALRYTHMQLIRDGYFGFAGPFWKPVDWLASSVVHAHERRVELLRLSNPSVCRRQLPMDVAELQLRSGRAPRSTRSISCAKSIPPGRDLRAGGDFEKVPGTALFAPQTPFFVTSLPPRFTQTATRDSRVEFSRAVSQCGYSHFDLDCG
jgi:peptidoglycan/LPS O-acetylase OafA/YrhL